MVSLLVLQWALSTKLNLVCQIDSNKFYSGSETCTSLCVYLFASFNMLNAALMIHKITSSYSTHKVQSSMSHTITRRRKYVVTQSFKWVSERESFFWRRIMCSKYLGKYLLLGNEHSLKSSFRTYTPVLKCILSFFTLSFQFLFFILFCCCCCCSPSLVCFQVLFILEKLFHCWRHLKMTEMSIFLKIM